MDNTDNTGCWLENGYVWEQDVIEVKVSEVVWIRIIEYESIKSLLSNYQLFYQVSDLYQQQKTTYIIKKKKIVLKKKFF